MTDARTEIEEGEAAPPGHWRPAPQRPIVVIIAVLLAIAAVLAVLAAWHLPPFRGAAETTDNAYVRGRVTVISPQVSGYISEVLVQDYAMVRKGQVIARIEDSTYRAQVAQAKAALDAQIAALANSAQAHAARTAGLSSQAAALTGAEAQLLRARADMGRAQDLVSDGSISRREYDQTRAALRQAEAQVMQARAANQIAREDIKTVDVGRGGLEAQVEAARAALHQAEINLSRTVIVAPEDGQLGEVGGRVGQFVSPGTQFVSLVPPDHWVIANFKEEQTAQIRVGQPVSFLVDALGGAKLLGHVERLSPATGSEFSVLKPDNATGNFVKVPQRLGIRIAVDKGQAMADRLRPGMSVVVKVDTRP